MARIRGGERHAREIRGNARRSRRRPVRNGHGQPRAVLRDAASPAAGKSRRRRPGGIRRRAAHETRRAGRSRARRVRRSSPGRSRSPTRSRDARQGNACPSHRPWHGSPSARSAWRRATSLFPSPAAAGAEGRVLFSGGKLDAKVAVKGRRSPGLALLAQGHEAHRGDHGRRLGELAVLHGRARRSAIRFPGRSPDRRRAPHGGARETGARQGARAKPAERWHSKARANSLSRGASIASTPPPSPRCRRATSMPCSARRAASAKVPSGEAVLAIAQSRFAGLPVKGKVAAAAEGARLVPHRGRPVPRRYATRREGCAGPGRRHAGLSARLARSCAPRPRLWNHAGRNGRSRGARRRGILGALRPRGARGEEPRAARSLARREG